jgi:hypothetical protein
MAEKRSDWKKWFRKIKWQLISFKFLSFFGVLSLLVAVWFSLESLFVKTVGIAEELYKKEFITQEGLSDIITKAHSTLYNDALGHLLVAAAAVLTAVIAIKGVTYFTESRQTTEVVKKLHNGELSSNLERFLPRGSRK